MAHKWSLKDVEGDNEDVIGVDAVSLTGKIRSKKDIYDFLTLGQQIYLPSSRHCPICKLFYFKISNICVAAFIQ